MKLAICLFGNVGISTDASNRNSTNLLKESEQASTDPQICYEGIRKNFLEKYETDVFIHSWSVNYKSKLENLYKPKSFIFEKQIMFKTKLEDYGINNKKQISEWKVSSDTQKSYELLLPSRGSVENVVKDLQKLSFRAKSRWYSTKKFIELMSDYSQINHIQYDFVLLSRIDCLFQESINLSKLDKNKFYASKRIGREDENLALYDFFFLSDQKNMTKFSKLYKNISNYSIRPPFASMQHAKNEFGEKNINHILDYNIDYDKVRVPEKSRLKFSNKIINFIKRIITRVFLNK